MENESEEPRSELDTEEVWMKIEGYVGEICEEYSIAGEDLIYALLGMASKISSIYGECPEELIARATLIAHRARRGAMQGGVFGSLSDDLVIDLSDGSN